MPLCSRCRSIARSPAMGALKAMMPGETCDRCEWTRPGKPWRIREQPQPNPHPKLLFLLGFVVGLIIGATMVGML